MLHALLHFYNLAPPEAKSAARAGAAFLAGAALAVLATACSPAYAEPADRGTIAPKPRGPVLDTPLNQRLHPHRKRGFFTPEFFRHGFAHIGMVSGVGAHTRKDCGMAGSMCLSPPPPVAPRQPTGVPKSQPGATMTPSPVASASARTPTTNAPTEEERAYALLQALSSASLARLYLHKNNVPAARRKAVLLLKTLQTLEAA